MRARARLSRVALMIIAFLDHARRHSDGRGAPLSIDQGRVPFAIACETLAHPPSVRRVLHKRPMHNRSRSGTIDRSPSAERAIDQSAAGAGSSKSRVPLSYRGGHSDVIMIRGTAAIVGRSARSGLAVWYFNYQSRADPANVVHAKRRGAARVE